MTTITSIDLQNSTVGEYVVVSGSRSFTLPPAMPGQPGKLSLALAIDKYTIKSGSLQVGSVQVSPDASITISPGTGGLTGSLSVVTTFGPA
ncbi:hypothetical protein E4U54_000103 [Claviceps lovelessii]|nr:hypothetical protein E4U54_000103 [Claviceps lovelessii]